MTYTAKNKENDQDNINFIDTTNAKNDLPNFLDYEKVLAHSIESDNVANEKDITSLCDGGDNLEPYFSDESAAYECKIYIKYQPFIIINNGEPIEKTLDFNSNIFKYELF